MSEEQKRLKLTGDVAAQLRAELPRTSADVVAAIVAEVPSYSRAFAGPMGETISQAVAVALSGFVDGLELGVPIERTANSLAVSGAYDLGRGEARSGRSMDALLSAYRVGARVSWQALAATAVAAGLSAQEVALFADLVFAYIDQLSASSVAGHSDELETAGRVRQRRLEKVARQIVTGASPEVVAATAEGADWPLPQQATPVLIDQAGVRRVLTGLGTRGDQTLVLTEDQPGVALGGLALLIVPQAARRTVRQAMGRRLRAVLGPTVEFTATGTAVRRTLRLRDLVDDSGLVDADEWLTELVLTADLESREELRAKVLAPLDDVRDSTREKLIETLRMWLLCQGRRDVVAQALFVHPQTVRYRMGLLREQYADRLDDPAYVRELLVALA